MKSELDDEGMGRAFTDQAAEWRDSGWLDAAVADAVQDGLLVIDGRRRITRVNRAFCELSGLDAGELVGRAPPYPFWADAERERDAGRWQQIDGSGGSRFEVTLRHRDGRLFAAVMSAAPARGPDGVLIAYVATFRDLSAAQAQARLERALRHVAATVAAEAPPAEVFERVAGEVVDLLGVPVASVNRFDGPERATRLASPGVPDWVPRTYSLLDDSAAARVARSGQPARVDDYGLLDGASARLAAAAGMRCAVAVPVTVAGRVWGALTAVAEGHGRLGVETEPLLSRFAELVAVAIANAQARERLHEQAVILGALQDGLLVVDASGRVTRANDALCRMTGFAPAELVGTTFPYPFSTGDSDELASTGGASAVERVLRRKDGSNVHVVASVGEFRDAAGRPAGRAATFKDISESVFQARLEGALREVAAASARGEHDAGGLFDLVAARVARLLDTPSAVVVRFDGEQGIRVGGYGRESLPERASLHEPSASALVADTGAPCRIHDYAELSGEFAAGAVATGLRCAVAVPVRLRGTLWGCLTVLSERPGGVAADTEGLLERFAELVSAALANADSRAALQQQASTDGLTGLLNQRAYHERLAAERRRARRYRRPLALAVFDLDGFKGVNDAHGHPAGDLVLQTVARAFADGARAGDVPARIGGDEFAVIAPDTDVHDAHALAERLRAATADALSELGYPVTLSAGVTDLSASNSVEDLVRMADGALYCAKHHGRNQTVRYAHDAVPEMTEEQRTRRFQRARTLTGLEALARAVQARDTAGKEYTDRAADVAEGLAVRLGWSADACARLREAALLHDIGKIAVPDALLRKAGRLSAEEFEQVKTHAQLSAQIANAVLDAEQLGWLRSHHERPDGRGYPDGLMGEDIPHGARLLAVADAFDAICSRRSWRSPRGPADAVAQMRTHRGTQFDAQALDALADWIAADGA